MLKLFLLGLTLLVCSLWSAEASFGDIGLQSDIRLIVD